MLLGTLAVSVVCCKVAFVWASWGLSDDGKQVETVFPDLDKAWRNDGGPEGTFPIWPICVKWLLGVTKEQLYGMFGTTVCRRNVGVREWDYIFPL